MLSQLITEKYKNMKGECSYHESRSYWGYEHRTQIEIKAIHPRIGYISYYYFAEDHEWGRCEITKKMILKIEYLSKAGKLHTLASRSFWPCQNTMQVFMRQENGNSGTGNELVFSVGLSIEDWRYTESCCYEVVKRNQERIDLTPYVVMAELEDNADRICKALKAYYSDLNYSVDFENNKFVVFFKKPFIFWYRKVLTVYCEGKKIIIYCHDHAKLDSKSKSKIVDKIKDILKPTSEHVKYKLIQQRLNK